MVDTDLRINIKADGTKAKQTLKSVGRSAAIAGAALAAASVVAIKAYGQQELAEKQLQIAIQNKGATEADYQRLLKQSSDLQKKGIFGDEFTLTAQSTLLTFGEIDTVMAEKLIPRILDFIAKEKGFKSSMADALTFSKLFGRAVAGDTGTLSRYGIKLQESERELLNVASATERADFWAKRLTETHGGYNEEQGKTYAGTLKRIGNEWGDLVEKVGQGITEGPLEIGGLQGLLVKMQELNEVLAEDQGKRETLGNWLFYGAAGLGSYAGLTAAAFGINQITETVKNLMVAWKMIPAPVKRFGIPAILAVGTVGLALKHGEGKTTKEIAAEARGAFESGDIFSGISGTAAIPVNAVRDLLNPESDISRNITRSYERGGIYGSGGVIRTVGTLGGRITPSSVLPDEKLDRINYTLERILGVFDRGTPVPE